MLIDDGIGGVEFAVAVVVAVVALVISISFDSFPSATSFRFNCRWFVVEFDTKFDSDFIGDCSTVEVSPSVSFTPVFPKRSKNSPNDSHSSRPLRKRGFTDDKIDDADDDDEDVDGNDDLVVDADDFPTDDVVSGADNNVGADSIVCVSFDVCDFNCAAITSSFLLVSICFDTFDGTKPDFTWVLTPSLFTDVVDNLGLWILLLIRDDVCADIDDDDDDAQCDDVDVDVDWFCVELTVLNCNWINIIWSPKRILKFNGVLPLKKSLTCESFKDSKACITVFSGRWACK